MKVLQASRSWRPTEKGAVCNLFFVRLSFPSLIRRDLPKASAFGEPILVVRQKCKQVQHALTPPRFIGFSSFFGLHPACSISEHCKTGDCKLF